ncbi:hypothetical protein KY290_022379 [Solanum tuberosum]|uniref:Uncharacterized protein n=1 Tax=Solanum tuberosum TaxID=4113 RepID=A0ABQ7V631_SOLTU|nr:hypothetical protein KY289_021496 [Solanum tuberosum]KAH0758886.1 hypothetical protein KY290_022379 [Solanum tuberosum]
MKEGKNLSNRIIETHRRRYVKCRDYFLFVKYNQGADEGPADVVARIAKKEERANFRYKGNG